MMAALAGLALLAAGALALVSFVQMLYLEALRLRPRERPALEFFKDTLAGGIGLESDRGALAFSLLKHSLLVLLGFPFALLAVGDGIRTLFEAAGGAWLAMLACCYVLPELLYRRTSGRWLAPLVPLLRALAALSRPLVPIFGFFHALAGLGEPHTAGAAPASAAENVDALISAGAEEGLIEESDRELIQSVVAFGDKTVREVMTPRPNIVAIGADQTLEELRELVIHERYSRIPVYEGSIDEILGFVHVRDMFELEEEERGRRRARELVRAVRFVPETKAVNDVLKEMQQDRAHMSVVVDEYGHTAGLVTLEDLVEEVFGEIRDEHEPELDITPDGEGAWVVSGNFSADRLADLVGFRPGEDSESTTVGGLVMEWLGRVPRSGAAAEREGVRLQVLACNGLRVEQVRVSRIAASKS